MARVKEIWNRLVPIWDDRSFYDFVATSEAFASRSFRHREVFGQVGFGTGGWDTDFPNSMLEILRVVVTNYDEDQRFIVGGVEQMPRRPVEAVAASGSRIGRPGTRSRSCTAARRGPASRGSAREADGRFAVTDRWGDGAATTPSWSPASPGS